MDNLNRRGKEFVNEWCNCRHSTTQRISNQHYLKEENILAFLQDETIIGECVAAIN